MNKLWARLKVAGAVLLSTVLITGAATVISTPEAAQAAAGPFTCTSDFYQVSNGKMYQYSVSSNTYTVMSASLNVSGLNAIGYNTGDNYIYGISGTKLYKIANDGSQVAATTLSGTAQTTGGDFIAPNKLLSVSNAGVWSLTDVTTHVATAFTATGTTWAAYDLAFNPTNSTVYGMDGTTLYIGKVTGTASVAVTTKPTSGSAGAAGDSWGAAYVDSAGDVYFFDNTTFKLVEISAANLANATPAAISITQANSLAAPNDGASCPTASSPLAPTVTTTAATSITMTTATLNGTVATGLPTGSNVPTNGIQICYSTANTLVNGSLSVSPNCAAATPSSLAANTAATAVTRAVTGLTAGTTYYFQAEATNAAGLEGFGSVLSFATTPLPNHTVVFNNNGGTGTMANEVTNTATPLTTNTFTRAGYTFSGWATTAGGTVAYADSASYPFTADATLYAVWAVSNHTVVFNNNGGVGTMSNEVSNLPLALTTNTFTRAGYTFSGWATTAGGTVAYANAASYPFTADATLYAVWAIANHTVIFNNNGGVGTMTNEVSNLPTALTTNTFTRAGYTFSGWATTAGGTVAYANAASYPFTADATLYAVWAIANHTVIFNNNGGVGTMTNEVSNLPAALSTNTFTRLGYSFSGWATTAGGTVAYADAASYPFTADATLYAVWTALPNHTVTFNNNGGTGTMADEVHNVPTALTTDTFTRAGYTFSGWATTAGGTVAYLDGASYPFGADATLYAVWTIANHTVIFNNNGGTGTMANEVNNLPAALTTNTFTRAGYTFSGWATTAGGTVVYTDAATYPFTADATLYAVWTIANHTVTFNNNGGVGTMANEVNNLPAALTTNTYTRAGYSFSGWATTAGGTVAYADAASYPFTADATLYAVWAVVNHTVVFNNNGGVGTMANEVKNLPTALTTNTFTRAGYTFSGWATSAGGTVAYADAASYPFAADATLYAVWAIANHTVVFNNNGGVGTMANEVSNLPTALTTNTFTRAGYTFSGWATTAGGTVAYADSAPYPFTADATLYAVWAIANHTVTFDNNGGTGTMPNEVSNLPAPLTTNTFTRAGYTFSGWATTAGGTVVYTDAATYPFTADANLYAVWTVANHTVIFDNNGGTGTMPNEVTNLPAPLTTNTFTRAGYTFSGWATTAGGTVVYTDAATYPFSADATLYAVWTIANHTVIFNNNGGTGTMTNEVSNLPAALTTNTFTRAGYTFSGWAATAGGTVAYLDGASFPFTSNATLYSVWAALPDHTVVFDNNGGAGTMTNEVENVPTALTTNSFTRLGFTFAGWNTAADGSGDSYANLDSYPFDVDATMFAQWTVVPSKTVTFDSNGGAGSMADEVKNIPTALTTNSFTRLGFTFAGWNTAADGSGDSYANLDSYPFDVDATMFAQWTVVPSKTVTFDSNGGAGSMADEVKNIPTALTTNSFTRLGYTFAGWNTAADGSGTAYADLDSYPFSTNATMFAQWTAIPNTTVTFDSNGGAGAMANEVANVPTALNADTFTRAGYTFAGWNTAANGTGTAYADLASYSFSSDATMYAQWTAIPTKTVTFDNNGGSGTMADQVDNVATALNAETFTRSGYTFVGWATTPGGAVAYANLASYPFTADGTLYAVWTAMPVHTVKFMKNGGNGVMADEVDSVSNPLTANSFARPGYVFTGWNTAADGSGTGYVDAEFFDFSSGDGVLFAQYSKAALAATGVDPSLPFELAMWFVGIGVTTMMTIALIGRRRRAATQH